MTRTTLHLADVMVAAAPSVDKISSTVTNIAGGLLICVFGAGFAYFAMSSKWGRALSLLAAAILSAYFVFSPGNTRTFLLEFANGIFGTEA